MDENAIKEAARERMFEAALEDVVRARADEGRVRGPNARVRWLAAAVILFGGLVTVGVAWERARGSGPGAQDPAAFDPIMLAVEEEFPWCAPRSFVTSTAQLESLPDTVDSLVISPAEEGLVEAAARPGIKSMVLRGDDVRLSRAVWQRIGGMPDLELLTVGTKATADDLRELRRAPKLRTLALSGAGMTLDTQVATALAELPRLSCVRLVFVDARSDGIVTLAGIPTLQALYVEKCDLEPDWVEAIGHLRMLRLLSVHATGKWDLDGPRYRFTVADARHLARLERLSSITLGRIVVDEEALGSLPRSLEVLNLRDEQPLSGSGLHRGPRASCRAPCTGVVRDDPAEDPHGRGAPHALRCSRPATVRRHRLERRRASGGRGSGPAPNLPGSDRPGHREIAASGPPPASLVFQPDPPLTSPPTSDRLVRNQR